MARQSQKTRSIPSERLPGAKSSPSLTNLIVSHFDAHQRKADGTRSKRSCIGGDVETRAARLKKEISDRLPSLLKQYHLDSSDVDNDENDDPQSFGRAKNGEEIDETAEEAIRDEITEAVIQCVKKAEFFAASGNSEEATDGVFELAAAFCSNPISSEFNYLNHKSFASLCQEASQASQAQLESVRSNGCRLLGICLKFLMLSHKDKNDGDDSDEEAGDEEEWMERCYKLAAKALLPRLTDKSQSVRNTAIKACAFFFPDQTTSMCEGLERYSTAIQKALIGRVAHDPSFANRSSAIHSLPISEATISTILERVRDVKPSVRIDALDVLKSKADLNVFSDGQLIDVLRYGLTERCPETFEAAAKMLCCGWMKSLKFKPLELLRILDVPGNEAVCAKALKVIIGAAIADDGSTLKELSGPECRAYREEIFAKLDLQEESIDPAMALFIRMRCVVVMESHALTAVQKSEQVNKVLPDLLVLCEVLQKHLAEIVRDDKDASFDKEQFEDDQCFVCVQLLQLARNADLREEAGRRHFLALVHTMLCSSETPDDLIESAIRVMAVMHDSEEEFLQGISKALEEVNDFDMESESLDSTELVSRQMRSLSIISVVLEHTRATADHTVLQTFPDIIQPCNSSSNAIVLEAGVSCVGKFLLLSDATKFPTGFRPFLFKTATNEQEVVEVRAQAILALCDLALLFDSAVVNSIPGDNDIDEVPCMDSLFPRLLDHPKEGLVVISAEACAKLFLANKLNDPDLLARLIVIFFGIDSTITEDTADEVSDIGSAVRLAQLLSMFFPAFSTTRKGRDLLLASIRPMLAIVDGDGTGSKVRKRALNSSTQVGKLMDYVCSTAMHSYTPDRETKVGGEDEEDGATEDNLFYPKISMLLCLSDFLLQESSTLSVAYLRALFKIIGAVKEDELGCSEDTIDNSKLLKRLKKNLDELSMMTTDHYALGSVEKLSDILEGAGIDPDEGSISGDDSENGDLEGADEESTDEGEEGCENESNGDVDDDETVTVCSEGESDDDDVFVLGSPVCSLQACAHMLEE